MSAPLNVRRAEAADARRLAAAGFNARGEASVFLAERDGELLAALAVTERAFETKVLGRATWHIDTIDCRDGCALSTLLPHTLQSLSAQGARLVTVRRPETERDVIASLETAGFRAIETLVTLSRDLDAAAQAMPAGVGIAGDKDADSCAAVARQSFSTDRFHADLAIANDAADELKAQWARNSVLGRADKVFVTRDGGVITGFNACLRNGHDAVIDLIAVSRGHQGQGLGRALTAASLAHYAGKAKRMNVGTQASNAASLALYRSAGFRITSSAITLHAHLS